MQSHIITGYLQRKVPTYWQFAILLKVPRSKPVNAYQTRVLETRWCDVSLIHEACLVFQI